MKWESSETPMSDNEMRNSQSWDHGEMRISLPSTAHESLKTRPHVREKGGLFLEMIFPVAGLPVWLALCFLRYLDTNCIVK